LAQEVGGTGYVLATDIDTRHLDGVQAPNVEIRSHDVVQDPRPPTPFDLIHTRPVLMHLPAREEEVLPRLVSALKPGGWLLLEEHNIFPVHALASGRYARVWRAFEAAVQGAGARSEWGRHLPSLLATHGLVDVGAEALAPLFPGGSASAQFWSLSWQQLRQPILARGVASEELNRALSDLEDPTQWFTAPAMVAVWGRKPLTAWVDQEEATSVATL
jgi:SAM-dependent methyltransferase